MFIFLLLIRIMDVLKCVLNVYYIMSCYIFKSIFDMRCVCIVLLYICQNTDLIGINRPQYFHIFIPITFIYMHFIFYIIDFI